MNELIHEQYIVDEHGEPTAIILKMDEFIELLKAVRDSNAHMIEVLGGMALRSAQLMEALESLDEVRAFDVALAAPAEDRETIPFDQAIKELENGWA